jgi:hypothetical protein
MKERDYSWIAIRFLGIYLLMQAIILIPTVADAVWSTYSLAQMGTVENEQLEKCFFQNMKSNLVQTSLLALLYGLMGIYFMFGGKLVHRWICLPGESED